MCLLFETIKVQDKILHNLDYHNERLNRSRFELFGCKDEIKLQEHIQIPEELDDEVYKCRVIYNKQIHKIDFGLYNMRKIDRLFIVHTDIQYAYKYLDRQNINELTLKLKSNEDILLVKDGFITDSSFANVCFWDGNEWITPATPLLRGTKRQKLLDKGEIIESEIKPHDLHKFEKVCLINGMLELGDIEITNDYILHRKSMD